MQHNKNELTKLIKEFIESHSEDVIREFGDWESAFASTGCNIRLRTSTQAFSDEDIVDALRQFHIKYGDEMTYDRYKKEGVSPSTGTITTRFGTWNNALKIAQLPLTGRKKRVSDKEIVEALRSAYHEIGDGFTVVRYNEWASKNKRVSYVTLKNRFGGWESALKKADIPAQVHTRKLSEEDVIEDILEGYDEIGEPFTTTKYREWAKENGKTSLVLAQKKFGTWKNALIVAKIR